MSLTRELTPSDLGACLGAGQVLTLQLGDFPCCPICGKMFGLVPRNVTEKPIVWQVPFHPKGNPMRHKETHEVQQTITVIDKQYETCDLCQKIIMQKPYSAEEAVVELTTGERYPEGGGGKKFFVDICRECFEEKLIPWLQNQDVVIQEEEWDY